MPRAAWHLQKKCISTRDTATHSQPQLAIAARRRQAHTGRHRQAGAARHMQAWGSPARHKQAPCTTRHNQAQPGRARTNQAQPGTTRNLVWLSVFPKPSRSISAADSSWRTREFLCARISYSPKWRSPFSARAFALQTSESYI